MKKLINILLNIGISICLINIISCTQPNTPTNNITSKPDSGESGEIEEKPLPSPLGIKILPAGTEGTFGTTGKYIEFGMWPQKRLVDEKIVEGAEKITYSGWDSCYKGTDGNYYLAIYGAPYWDNNKIFKFDDGAEIKSGIIYYFKFEPIKWRVLTENYNGKTLLLAETALAAPPDDIHGDMGYYACKDYLNEKFLLKAFTEEQRNNIPKANVTGTGSKPEDKVFLLSCEEMSNTEYGFDKDITAEDPKRIRKTTDFARNTGARVDIGNPNSEYWLRTPYTEYKNDDYNFNVTATGNASSYNPTGNNGMSIVPAITVYLN